MKFLNNMKTILFFISVFFVSSFFSQNLNIKIEGEIVNSKFKEAALLNWGFKDSLTFQKQFKINENGSFSLSTSIPCEDYYVIAFPGKEFIPLILRKNSDIKISGEEKKVKKYVPLSKRQDKPDSVLWLIKNYSLLKDSQIARLVGVTTNSVISIINKNYWNYNNLNAKDPVSIGLFSQKELIDAVERAKRRIKRENKEKAKEKA